MSQPSFEIRVGSFMKNVRAFTKGMGAQVAEKQFLNAMSRAVDPVVRAAKARVPFDANRRASNGPKHLRDVIRSFRMPSTLDKGYRVSVSYPKQWYYGHMVEFGSVHHKPIGFLRSAFDEKSGEYADLLLRYGQQGFKRALAAAKAVKS